MDANQQERTLLAKLRPPWNRHILDLRTPGFANFAGDPKRYGCGDPAALTGIQAVVRLLHLCLKDGTD